MMTVSVGIEKVVVVVRGTGSEDSRQSIKYFIIKCMYLLEVWGRYTVLQYIKTLK